MKNKKNQQNPIVNHHLIVNLISPISSQLKDRNPSLSKKSKFKKFKREDLLMMMTIGREEEKRKVAKKEKERAKGMMISQMRKKLLRKKRNKLSKVPFL